MATNGNIVDTLSDAGLIHRVGGGRIKLTRESARLVSAIAAVVAREWDGVAYRIHRATNKSEPREHAQKIYARNASSALRALVTRAVQKWREDDLVHGNRLAEEHHAETDFEFDPTAVVAKNLRKK